MKKGFTLIELLVVIAIIGVMSSVVLSSLTTARMKARDAQRLSTLRSVRLALEVYYDQFNAYPTGGGGGLGGFDTDYDGTFITPLVTNKFLPVQIKDPNLSISSSYNYQYRRYDAVTIPACGRAFYILGIRDLEGTTGIHPSSPGLKCPPGCSGAACTWDANTLGFEWVTGDFEY
jgi:prepilin-type N-terminal cleavage/methylation domain-containing protein